MISLRLMEDYLAMRNYPEVKELFIDHEVDNIRAIKCYQKAGFQNVGEIIDEEGDKCLLHKIVFED